MIAGVLALDKPVGPTSHDAVDRARRSLGTRRIGHFGTLDPFASGLLVLGVGPATRLAAFCAGHTKTYLATVRLGERSDTDDVRGSIVRVPTESIPDPAAVWQAAMTWTGTVRQVPPAYSAKHVGGRRAYALARAGETVTLDAAVVRIHAIEIVRYEWPELEIVVRCGPGTYVRALARDLGDELGTGGLCARLRRVSSGPFGVERAISWDELADPARTRAALEPAARAVDHLPGVTLDEIARGAFAAGREVGLPGPSATGWVRVEGPRGFVGMGEVTGGGGSWVLRPRRVLFPEGEDAA